MPTLASTARDDARLRFRVFTALVIGVVAFLGARLVQMQIVDREEYAAEATGNAIETKIVRPARGYIFDRNGILMVDNETTVSVTLAPRYFDEADLPLLAELSGRPFDQIKERYDEIVERSAYQEDVILENVPFWTFARVQENQYRLRGINFREDQQRRYHGSARLTHALGYVNEIGADELDEMREQGYRLGDRVGKTGLEAEYEPVLRGRVGREFVLKNVHGMEVEAYEGGAQDVPPQSGAGLVLAVDSKVQALAESLFVNKRGGAVMMDVKTGGIISMVSAPDYDLSIYEDGFTQQEVDFLYRNPEKPEFNRATQASLPPGSTWKPFMSAIALQEGMIDENTTLFCGGGYVLGRLYRCHGGAHGQIAVEYAIQKSCNTFFFRLMNDTFPTPEGPKRMNLDMFGYWTRQFGFGQLAPLDIPNQNAGLIPDSTYYNDRWGVGGWGPGFTVNLGIGQGNMGASPLQLARYTAAVANGGTLVTPHLVKSITDPATGVVREPTLKRPTQIPIEPRNFRVVRKGMMEAVDGAGTARLARIEASGEFPKIPMAGKTGTAQNPRGKDHSVFIAYAPADDPQVAVGVMVENIGYGGTTAAPIASLMIEQYLRGRIVSPQRAALVEFVRSQKSVGRI